MRFASMTVAICAGRKALSRLITSAVGALSRTGGVWKEEPVRP